MSVENTWEISQEELDEIAETLEIEDVQLEQRLEFIEALRNHPLLTEIED